MEWLKLRLSKYFVVKSIKDSGTSEKGYFIRLDDNIAFINDGFFVKILEMMKDIREEIKRMCFDKYYNLNEAKLRSQEFYVK
jgi:DNA-binding cell septation regulator SpoVG